MWHRNRFIGVLCRGRLEKDVVRQFYSNLQRRHRAYLRGNKTGKIYNDQIKTHAIPLKDGATHSDENKPRCMAKGPQQPEREVS